MSGIYQPGYNCWQSAKADKAALLIDCANYYRALYHALCAARHSIFILGWDIDGRIELLRGREAEEAEIPVNLLGLVRHKAKENPDLKVYLDRWNYSVFFTKERESFSGIKWHAGTSPNVHYCADYKIPFAACHHQKVIVIDDALAFCGGMDIALGRWDRRQHHIKVSERVDPGGLLTPFLRRPYEPYHDIQMMVTGPVVRVLSELTRWRWERGAGFSSIPMPVHTPSGDDIWPAHVRPDFENIHIGVARTIPKTPKTEVVNEILHMYVDEIATAEKFIYIENQYLTCQKIARAINSRLHEKPGLRVLAVSCDHPRGFMEHKAMWTGRVEFCDIVLEGIDSSRIAVTYPVCRENDTEKTIHIHSKLMIVDNRFLHVGSANLNNRSMGFDTECDLVIEANDEKTASRIAAIRNNLIREHTGRAEQQVAEMIDGVADLDRLLEHQKQSRQHLKKINNEPYRNEIFERWGRKLGDPSEPYIQMNLPVRQILFGTILIVLLGILLWSWLNPVFSGLFEQEGMISTIEKARESNWGILWVMGIYIFAGMVFFPVTVLNLTTAVVFGPIYGIIMALAGCLASATLGFAAGRFIGEQALHLFRPVIEKIRHYARSGGVLGMTLVRLMPIAPFTLVNVTFGISKVSFTGYLLATVFGLLPGIFAKAMFGGALGQLWEHPEPRVIFFTVGSLLLWIFIIWASQRALQHYKRELEL